MNLYQGIRLPVVVDSMNPSVGAMTVCVGSGFGQDDATLRRDLANMV